LRATRPSAAIPKRAKPAGAGTSVPPVELDVDVLVDELVLVLLLVLEGGQLLGRQALAGEAIATAAAARAPEAASFKMMVFMFVPPSEPERNIRTALPKLRPADYARFAKVDTSKQG
jgi:hypothetical protein